MKVLNGVKFSNKDSEFIICNPDKRVKETFFYIQETGCLKKEDSSLLTSHEEEMFMILAVISGRGELLYNGERHSIAEGDCFFIDCSVPHSFESSDDDAWEIMWFRFNGSTSRQYYEYFSDISKNIFHPDFFDKAVGLITAVLNECKAKEKRSDAVVSKLIVDMLTFALTENDSERKYDTGLKQKLSSINAYIEEHFSEDLTLEKLSSTFYISKYYLTREYKKIYGKTIFQHIITARINYGKRLLRFSDKSVEEIAPICGFNDQSYFARQFMKNENQTCFSYRKKWR
ncbi:MAG: AraC family transcriptional regulator [Ruminococcus sp.]|nr:AraC family transcriptional regulator [Ruminococcus sp.]